MAETVHLYLKANGKDIKGESFQSSLGRADSIECVHLESSMTSAREAASGLATGRRRHEALQVHKRIDKSTPLLAKALVNNEGCEGILKFFRPSPKGDGTTQQFFTISFKGGRVFSQKLLVYNTLDSDAVNHPPLEEVSFVFTSITWTFEDGGITHTDDWAGGKE